MADKPISDLTAATQINALDLFVLQQDGTAKKLTGQILMNWLVSFADGHGGIQSITKTDTNGLADTYTVTLSDTTTFSFTVTNGKGIAAVTKTATAGLVDTYTVSYNDGTATTFPVTNGKGIASWGKTGSQGLEDTYLVTYNDGTTFSYSVKNGEKGDTGDNAYIHIKYASQQPTEESPSIGDVPDRWMGVYTGTQVQPPAQYTDYKWYEVKGEKGDTGDAAAVISQEVVFQVSDSGTIYPSGAWSQQIPVVPQGKYLWTRSTVVFNSGAPQISYSVARFGLDGLGSVSSVNNVSPDSGGNVSLTAGDVEALPISGGSMTGPVYMDGQKLSGLNAPTDQDEAATKGYVDTNYVPQTRKVNGKALSEDVVLTAADVKAVNPNLLDNWYLPNPVNQRGKTSYTGDGYTVDRWQLGNWNNPSFSASIVSDGLQIQGSATAANSVIIAQKVEAIALRGKTVTVSILISNHNNSGNNDYLQLNIDGAAVALSSFKGDGLFTRTITVPATASDLQVRIGKNANNGSNGNTNFTLVAAKLEIGDCQTLAHKDANGNWVLNEIPDFGEQLERCQRYYIAFKDDANIGFGLVRANGSFLSFQMELPVTMRTTPTITASGDARAFTSTAAATDNLGANNFYLWKCVGNRAWVRITTAIPAGFYDLFLTNGACSITFSADF